MKFKNIKFKTELNIWPNGYRAWYENGKRHRLDGPAMIYSNGNQYWRENGELHRLNGPAIIFTDGPEEWWENGKQLHRTDNYPSEKRALNK